MCHANRGSLTPQEGEEVVVDVDDRAVGIDEHRADRNPVQSRAHPSVLTRRRRVRLDALTQTRLHVVQGPQYLARLVARLHGDDRIVGAAFDRREHADRLTQRPADAMGDPKRETARREHHDGGDQQHELTGFRKHARERTGFRGEIVAQVCVELDEHADVSELWAAHARDERFARIRVVRRRRVLEECGLDGRVGGPGLEHILQVLEFRSVTDVRAQVLRIIGLFLRELAQRVQLPGHRLGILGEQQVAGMDRRLHRREHPGIRHRGARQIALGQCIDGVVVLRHALHAHDDRRKRQHDDRREGAQDACRDGRREPHDGS
jgi:hypothetical protein